tara:strand:- start:11698 stop:12357 length:660 start_codon:yes stop_codon:yes gene_type:complete
MLYDSVVDFTILNHKKNCSDFSFFLQKNRKNIHPPGFFDCFLNKKSKLVFMHIDKCASTSVSNFCLKNDDFCDMSFRIKNIDKFNDYVRKNNYFFLAIIRNPIDRYISGIQEFIKRYNPSNDYIEKNLKNNKFIFDEHTSPQYIFLSHCKYNLKYVKLDKNLSNKLSNILGYDVNLGNCNYSSIHDKIYCNELYLKYLKDNKNFFDLYKKDFELFEASE